LLFHLKNSGFLELSNVSETHQRCTSEMLIDATACEDTRIEAARALATGEGQGEEYVSRTVGGRALTGDHYKPGARSRDGTQRTS
jgi:hypothetical protein